MPPPWTPRPRSWRRSPARREPACSGGLPRRPRHVTWRRSLRLPARASGASAPRNASGGRSWASRRSAAWLCASPWRPPRSCSSRRGWRSRACGFQSRLSRCLRTSGSSCRTRRTTWKPPRRTRAGASSRASRRLRSRRLVALPDGLRLRSRGGTVPSPAGLPGHVRRGTAGRSRCRRAEARRSSPAGLSPSSRAAAGPARRATGWCA
jgi:hypothetical protein